MTFIRLLFTVLFIFFNLFAIIGAVGFLGWVYNKIKWKWDERQILAVVVVVLLIPIVYFYAILIIDGTYNLLCLYLGNEWMDWNPKFKIIWLPTPEEVPQDY